MFASDSITSDYWRHHIPFAPDLQTTVIVGQTTVIDLKEHLIQGARDYVEKYSPEPLILPGLVPVQRGWLLDIVQTNDGQFGHAEISDFRDGFKYTPYPSSPSTTDCFNYQLTNGTQLSNYGRVTVDVIKPIEPIWKIFADNADVYLPNQTNGTYSMSFDITVGHSSFFKSPAYKIRWYVTEPKAVVDNDGVTRVYLSTTVYSSTSWLVNDWDGSVTVVNTGKAFPKREYKTDKDVVGIDPLTNAPYIPKNKFPDVYVEYINYPHRWQLPPSQGPIWDTNRPEIYGFKIGDVFGKTWNRSGKITLVGQL
ncbi:MAG: hypothetical protein ACRC6V_03605 [Bacteroidales bacterium]